MGSSPTGRSGTRLAMAVAAVAAAMTAASAPAAAGDGRERAGEAGVVYTLSNAARGNEVIAFARDARGRLAKGGSFATGGDGLGAGLGSQGALTLSGDQRFLLAVNAGSDEISAFAVRRGGDLELLDTVASGGDMPISVAVHGRLAYVLNAGGTPGISGFRLDRRGLEPIVGSTRALSPGAAGPAQVSFTPHGSRLVVTEKESNSIDTFEVLRNGRTGPPVTSPSAGATPFGFGFDRRGRLLVTNAEGGAPGVSSATSYAVKRSGALVPISGPVSTTQTAACWLVVTGNGRFAYTTNTGSGSLSSFRVRADGSIRLLNPVAAAPGGATIDADFAAGSRFLYALDSAGVKIDAFRVDRQDGSLAPVDSDAGLPPTAVGLAAL
jgi:6-phosphogluconolactonase